MPKSPNHDILENIWFLVKEGYPVSCSETTFWITTRKTGQRTLLVFSFTTGKLLLHGQPHQLNNIERKEVHAMLTIGLKNPTHG